jgi:spermidine/putrescine transport system substrate-binding protein
MRPTPDKPLSPEAAAVLRATGLSRRRMLHGALAGGALVASAGVLAACGTKGAKQTSASCVSTDKSATEKELIFSNWPLYMDEDEKVKGSHPTLDKWSKDTGIKVRYIEDINDNNQFFGKIQPQLAACQPTSRDLIVMTDWMASRLISLGWIQKLNTDNLPNVKANLLDGLRGRSWDKGTDHAVPWQSGLTGLAYNPKYVKTPVKTIDELLTRPDLKGKVTMLSEMHDTMGLMLLSIGKDPENFTDADFDTALEKLKKAVGDGQIRKFTGNEYAPDLDKGDIAACVAWSGDIVQLDNAEFVTPDSGVMLWSDNMMVPNKASHKTNAEKLMNYYYDPAVAAELAAYVNYICPVKGAQAEMEKIDKDLASNPLIFPNADTQAKAKVFMALSDAKERDYQNKFQQVIGA